MASAVPGQTRGAAWRVAWLYVRRRPIATGFEPLKALGLDCFMGRDWQAISRLLWIAPIAYTLLLLALHAPRLARLRRQAGALLRQQSVVGADLTVGKLAEALGLDFAGQRRAWAAVWLL